MRVHVVMRLLVIALVMMPVVVDAAPARGTVKIESVDATPDDVVLFERVARELASHEDIWAHEPRGTKTFRLTTYTKGGVRGLTETESTLDDVVVCKLMRARLWRLRLKSTEVRRVTVTFRFRPR